VRPTVPEAVTSALFAKVRGAVGFSAAVCCAVIETSFVKLVLYPTAFLDSTLNLYTEFATRVALVVYSSAVIPDYNTTNSFLP